MDQPDAAPPSGSLYPVTFTQRKRVVLLNAIKQGLTIRAACARAGVSKSTLYRVLAEDKEGTLQDAIDRAQGEAEARLVDAITTAAHTGETLTTPGGATKVMPGDWRAAAWLLEHHPQTREAYAGILRQKMQLSGDPDGPPVEIEVEGNLTTTERMAAVVTVLQRAGVMPIPQPGDQPLLLDTPPEPDGATE